MPDTLATVSFLSTSLIFHSNHSLDHSLGPRHYVQKHTRSSKTVVVASFSIGVDSSLLRHSLDSVCADEVLEGAVLEFLESDGPGVRFVVMVLWGGFGLCEPLPCNNVNERSRTGALDANLHVYKCCTFFGQALGFIHVWKVSIS